MIAFPISRPSVQAPDEVAPCEDGSTENIGDIILQPSASTVTSFVPTVTVPVLRHWIGFLIKIGTHAVAYWNNDELPYLSP
jgi:hypothetical protein